MLMPFIPQKYRAIPTKSELSENSDNIPPIVHTGKRLPIIVGPSVDPNFSFLRKHFSTEAHFLSLETMVHRWMPSVENNQLIFSFDGSNILNSGVYLRSAELSPEYEFTSIYETFYIALDHVDFRTIGARRFCYRNASKPTQMKATIAGLSPEVGIPSSYIVKKEDINSQSIKRHFPKAIVKSICGMRCQVTDDKTFARFNFRNIKNLPVMFQERLDIKREIRIHLINGKLFPLAIKSHGAVDYRYSTKATYNEDITLSPAIVEFCHNAQTAEANPLVGIDLVETESGYKCFEVNPNPGWGAFNYTHKTKLALGQEVLKYLKEENI